MKYFSEMTNQYYSTEDACLRAEKDYQRKLESQQEKQKALAAEKKARADEVVNAFRAGLAANKGYLKLRDKFVKDYGYFHFTFTDTDDSSFFECPSLFDLFRL